jgi:cobalt-zinc-cadmium efflux system membrane fusion protein
MRTQRFVSTFSATLLSLAALAGCGRKEGSSAASAVPTPPAAEPRVGAPAGFTGGMPETVRLASAAIAEAGVGTWTVRPVSLEHLLILNGTVGYDENRYLQVSANVRGRVVSIPVDLGTRVRKGDVLATIESVDLGRAREEFIREQTALRVAGRSYERAKTLVEAKAISMGEFQSREGDYLSKKAAAEAAERALHLLGETQEQVDRMRARARSGGEAHDPDDGSALALRAPFAGRVIERKVTPGALFEALQPLLTLADLSTVWVFLQAYEKDLALLRDGVAVTIRTEAYPQEAFKGEVDFLGSIVDAATRTVKLRASVANAAEKLRPGMFVKAQVDVPQSYEGRTVLAVPQSALQTLEGRTTVFLQTTPGVFARRIVETGHSFEGFTEVYSGIKAGDIVVTEGSFILKSEFARSTLVEEE